MAAVHLEFMLHGHTVAMTATTYSPKPLGPADLRLIEGVLDEACERRGLSRTGPEAEFIAAELVELFAYGVREKRELGALIS